MTVVLVVAASLVAFVALVAWLALRPGPPSSQLRVRSAPPGSTCSTVDLELRLAASVAVVRTWQPLGDGSGRCVASARQGMLTAEQLERARVAAREVGEGGFVRSLAMGERRPGRVALELSREGAIAETTSSRSFDGLVPPGVAALEALHAELVAALTPGSTTSLPAGAPTPGPAATSRIQVADPRSADLTEVLAALQADATRRVPGAGLQSMTVVLTRGGSIDLTSQVVNVELQNATTRIGYRLDRGALRTGEPTAWSERSPPPPSPCSSRDLWKKAIAAGMKDAARMQLVLMLGPRPEGGAKTVWAFHPVDGGRFDPRLKFDAATCALEPR